jgi:hypothetical protein
MAHPFVILVRSAQLIRQTGEQGRRNILGRMKKLGNPIDLLMPPEASPEVIAQIKARSALTSRSTSNISAGGSAMVAILTRFSSTRLNNWTGPSAKIWRR